MGVIHFKFKFLTFLTSFILFAVIKINGENITLNSYKFIEDQLPQNVMYRVSLNNNIITDSLILNYRGAFFHKYPIDIQFHNFSFLLNFIQNGLPAKNAFPPKGRMDTYYFIINSGDFDIIFSDSLPFRGIVGIEKLNENRISYRWSDELEPGRPAHEDIIGISNNHRLRIYSSQSYIRPDFTLNDIGNFKNPKALLSTADTITYWDLGPTGSDIYLFRHNLSAGILSQTVVGDRTEMNIVIGYNESSNKIYSFFSPYKMYSYSPPVYSSDTLNMAIGVYDPQTLNKIDSLAFPVGEAYSAMEIGTADSQGPYLYYYYFWQDGYIRFDPAYLLIFDTRTNEASWLRVGWR